MHHDRLIPKASSTSDVAVSSSEVAAPICSTTWRHQFGESTTVKHMGQKEQWQRLLTSLYCYQIFYFAATFCYFLHVFASKLAKWASKRCEKMWEKNVQHALTTKTTTSCSCWGDGSSQACCQRKARLYYLPCFVNTETHQYACVPITNRNVNRDTRNNETQTLNPSARTFSRPSVFIANTFLRQVTGPVLNHHINDAVMVCPNHLSKLIDLRYDKVLKTSKNSV